MSLSRYRRPPVWPVAPARTDFTNASPALRGGKVERPQAPRGVHPIASRGGQRFAPAATGARARAMVAPLPQAATAPAELARAVGGVSAEQIAHIQKGLRSSYGGEQIAARESLRQLASGTESEAELSVLAGAFFGAKGAATQSPAALAVATAFGEGLAQSPLMQRSEEGEFLYSVLDEVGEPDIEPPPQPPTPSERARAQAVTIAVGAALGTEGTEAVQAAAGPALLDYLTRSVDSEALDLLAAEMDNRALTDALTVANRGLGTIDLNLWANASGATAADTPAVEDLAHLTDAILARVSYRALGGPLGPALAETRAYVDVAKRLQEAPEPLDTITLRVGEWTAERQAILQFGADLFAVGVSDLPPPSELLAEFAGYAPHRQPEVFAREVARKKHELSGGRALGVTVLKALKGPLSAQLDADGVRWTSRLEALSRGELDDQAAREVFAALRSPAALTLSHRYEAMTQWQRPLGDPLTAQFYDALWGEVPWGLAAVSTSDGGASQNLMAQVVVALELDRAQAVGDHAPGADALVAALQASAPESGLAAFAMQARFRALAELPSGDWYRRSLSERYAEFGPGAGPLFPEGEPVLLSERDADRLVTMAGQTHDPDLLIFAVADYLQRPDLIDRYEQNRSPAEAPTVTDASWAAQLDAHLGAAARFQDPVQSLDLHALFTALEGAPSAHVQRGMLQDLFAHPAFVPGTPLADGVAARLRHAAWQDGVSLGAEMLRAAKVRTGPSAPADDRAPWVRMAFDTVSGAVYSDTPPAIELQSGAEAQATEALTTDLLLALHGSDGAALVDYVAGVSLDPETGADNRRVLADFMGNAQTVLWAQAGGIGDRGAIMPHRALTAEAWLGHRVFARALFHRLDAAALARPTTGFVAPGFSGSVTTDGFPERLYESLFLADRTPEDLRRGDVTLHLAEHVATHEAAVRLGRMLSDAPPPHEVVRDLADHATAMAGAADLTSHWRGRRYADFLTVYQGFDVHDALVRYGGTPAARAALVADLLDLDQTLPHQRVAFLQDVVIPRLRSEAAGDVGRAMYGLHLDDAGIAQAQGALLSLLQAAPQDFAALRPEERASVLLDARGAGFVDDLGLGLRRVVASEFAAALVQGQSRFSRLDAEHDLGDAPFLRALRDDDAFLDLFWRYGLYDADAKSETRESHRGQDLIARDHIAHMLLQIPSGPDWAEALEAELELSGRIGGLNGFDGGPQWSMLSEGRQRRVFFVLYHKGEAEKHVGVLLAERAGVSAFNGPDHADWAKLFEEDPMMAAALQMAWQSHTATPGGPAAPRSDAAPNDLRLAGALSDRSPADIANWLAAKDPKELFLVHESYAETHGSFARALTDAYTGRDAEGTWLSARAADLGLTAQSRALPGILDYLATGAAVARQSRPNPIFLSGQQASGSADPASS